MLRRGHPGVHIEHPANAALNVPTSKSGALKANDFAPMKQFEARTKGYAQACQVRLEHPNVASLIECACANFLAVVPVRKRENAKVVRAFLAARTAWWQQRSEQKAIEMEAQKGAA